MLRTTTPLQYRVRRLYTRFSQQLQPNFYYLDVSMEMDSESYSQFGENKSAQRISLNEELTEPNVAL